MINAPLRLGVVVPCHNETAVLPRKLANLARLSWPQGDDHRIVVVDDGSDDVTGSLARSLAADMHAVPVEVLDNIHAPGKAGAIATALEHLGESVDVLVLTDADVVLSDDALEAVARAFATRPDLGMACGSQRFVEALGNDGTARAPDGSTPVPVPGRYDRLTAAVRRRESRSGRLFSVHGQLLAWRTSLHLRATPGLAADDLDLMLQVRSRHAPIVKLPDALFHEVKTPPGPARRSQELRRARAYVQLVRSRPLPPPRDLAERLQFLFYLHLPLAAPPLALTLAIAAPLIVAGAVTPLWGAMLAAAELATLALPAGRHLTRLLTVIARATRAESQGALSDRWDMTRH